MAFTKITNADLKSRGCTTLPNQPAISAQALKEEFDAPAKEVVAPKVNNLIDELEATTSAASLGAVAPTGYTGNTIQLILDALGTAVRTLEASQVGATPPSGQTGDDVQTLINSLWAAIQVLQGSAHTHSNKSLLDSYTQTESDLADAVSSKHTHSNKSTLDKLTEDSDGNPLFNGNVIPTSGHTGGLQTFIQRDLLPPSGTGQLGDLEFVDEDGETCSIYRYESSGWEKINVGSYFEYDDTSVTPFNKVVVSTLDIGEGQTLADGTLWLVYENSTPNNYVITGLDTGTVTVVRKYNSTVLSTETITADRTLDDQIRIYPKGAYMPGDVQWYVVAKVALVCNGTNFAADAYCTNTTSGSNEISIT